MPTPARPPHAEVDPGDSLIDTAAQFLLTFSSDAGRGLLEEHHSDDSGHCRACYSSAGAFPVWPCILWTIAHRAQALAAHPPTGGRSR